VAHESGALRTNDLARVTVDTTVQPKDITFPTDAKLLHAAIKGLTRLARKRGVRLRQSYGRVGSSQAFVHALGANPTAVRRVSRPDHRRPFSKMPC
jgi:IS5 family transposase